MYVLRSIILDPLSLYIVTFSSSE